MNNTENEVLVGITKIFSPMKIFHNADTKELYFKFFNQERQYKKYVRYNNSNLKYFDALEMIRKKRLDICKELYPKIGSLWTGNLDDLRREYAEILKKDDKVYKYKS